jgi:uncharacterized repeat protein (TIGR01451 family)
MFLPETGNDYKGKSLEFDFIIGANGEAITESNDGDFSAAITGGGNTLFRTDNFSSFLSDTSQSEPEAVQVMGEAGAPNFEVVKTPQRGLANPGETGFIYTITITNLGNLSAYAVTLTDNLPAGIVLSGSDERVVTWQLGDLAPGESRSVECVVDILATAEPGEFTNVAQASATNHDTIAATAKVELVRVDVLGETLEPTGFSNKELIIMLSLGILIIYSSIFFRKRYLS